MTRRSIRNSRRYLRTSGTEGLSGVPKLMIKTPVLDLGHGNQVFSRLQCGNDIIVVHIGLISLPPASPVKGEELHKKKTPGVY